MIIRASDAASAVDDIVAVSRETLADLETYVALLRHWQKGQNLVAPATLEHVWSRHVADSAQALAARPEARRWIDLGSGAGFPGLVTAILLKGGGDAQVHLVESNRGKAAFLRAVARETGAPAIVHADRVDSVSKSWSGPVDAISARALAPLGDLLKLAQPFMGPETACIFHKGQDFASEIAQATQSWRFDVVEHVSRIDPAGRILVITGLEPR